MPWLMQPILNSELTSPEVFSIQLNFRTRNIVERCIGMLKEDTLAMSVGTPSAALEPVKVAKIENACIAVDVEETAHYKQQQTTGFFYLVSFNTFAEFSLRFIEYLVLSAQLFHAC